jgi:hypothetical protein
MELLPRRSGITELSDDELLLFDFLFDTGVENRFLRKESYPVHMAVRYTHGLDDCQLETTLQSLQERGLIERESRIDPLFDECVVNRLTPSGGRLWELERRPIWDRFCMDSGWRLSTTDPTRIQFLRVESPTKETCEEFLRLGLETGYLQLAGKAPQVRRLRLAGLPWISWKKFPEAYAIVAKVKADASAVGSQNFHEIQEHFIALSRFCHTSVFWRCVAELDRLHHKLDNQ